MNLAEAVEIAGAPARLRAADNAEDLLKKVADSGVVPAGRSLSLACAPGGIVVRPAEALHLLSLVTSHTYSNGDLHDAYAWWGLLRYLGFFDHDKSNPEDPVLRVSQARAQVKGVQRRVASEELGDRLRSPRCELALQGRTRFGRVGRHHGCRSPAERLWLFASP